MVRKLAYDFCSEISRDTLAFERPIEHSLADTYFCQGE